MAKSKEGSFHPFDFSQEAGKFKSRLWQHLQSTLVSPVQELDDDDLEWLNAAGTPFLPNDMDNDLL